MSYNFNDVREFHNKFSLVRNARPTKLTEEQLEDRIKFMFEEFKEFCDASGIVINYEQGGDLKVRPPLFKKDQVQDIYGQADALIDLVYVAMGTAVMMGLPWQELWSDVHRANMEKELRESVDHKAGIFKPENWQPPKTEEIIDAKLENPKGLIVLDGPDGCGKTTLALKICEMYNGFYIHNTWTPELQKVMDNYQTECLEEAIEKSKETLVVIDRLWLSEICYSEGMRGGSEYPELHKKLCDRIEEVGGLNIVCMPTNIKKGITRFNKLKEERQELFDNIEKVFHVYDALYNGGVYPFNTQSNFLTSLTFEPLKYKTNFIDYDMDFWELKDLEDLISRYFIPNLKKSQELTGEDQ